MVETECGRYNRRETGAEAREEATITLELFKQQNGEKLEGWRKSVRREITIGVCTINEFATKRELKNRV